MSAGAPESFPHPRVRSLLFEATPRCNQACRFCYNAWRGEDVAPRPEPSTYRSRRILKRAIRGSGCEQVTFTGGEPTLREDLLDLVAYVRILGARATVISNGALLDRRFVRDLARVGCGMVQLTFAGTEAGPHDDLIGRGTFVRATRALDAIRGEGMRLGLSFVMTRRNLAEAARFPAFARRAGVKLYLFNRFNPGGLGRREVDALLPTVAELQGALGAVDAAAARARVTPFVSVPIMPCIASARRYPRLKFATGCSAGTARSYFTLDAWGDVRFCNHTPTALGNVLERPFLDIVSRSPALAAFRDARPPFCRPCPGWDRCRGGCRAASEQLFGRADVEDPLLRFALDRGEIRPPGAPGRGLVEQARGSRSE